MPEAIEGGGVVTVQETIDQLMEFKDKSITLYFDCRHCGHPLELVEAKLAVLVSTKEPK